MKTIIVKNLDIEDNNLGVEMEEEKKEERLSLVEHSWSKLQQRGKQLEWSCPVQLVFRRFSPHIVFNLHIYLSL